MVYLATAACGATVLKGTTQWKPVKYQPVQGRVHNEGTSRWKPREKFHSGLEEATYGQKLKASRTLASVSTASPMSTPRSSLTPRCLRRTDSLELPLLSPQRPRPPPPPKADPWRDLVFKTSFQTADKDGDGRLSFAEFSLMLRRSDPTLNRAQIEEAWAAADLDGDRFVSPEEFVHWAKPLDALDDEGEDDAVEPSAALFRLWDLDENGAISPEELEFVMSKVRPRLSEQELAELFAVMDADRDGAVSYAEFVEFLFES